MMQALQREKMKFVNSKAIVVANVDTVSFMVQEFRKDPSAKWFDPKTKSAGLVSSIRSTHIESITISLYSSEYSLL